MPVTIKTNSMKYKNPATNDYESFNAVQNQTTANQIANIQNEGALQIAAVRSATTSIVGNLSNLNTEDKSSVVAAVNEVNNRFISDVDEAVSDWLDQHPDITTTVEDGSISKQKLNSDLYSAYLKSGSALFFFPDLSTGGYSGVCSLVVTPTKTFIMDTGPLADWTQIKTYFDDLYSNGVFTNIDGIIISHYHYDHIENLENLLTMYPHENCHVYLPMNPAGYGANSTSIQNFRTSAITLLTNNNISYTEVAEDTTLSIDGDYITCDLFNSNASNYSYYSSNSAVYNNYSMVAQYKIGNSYVMYPGDIQRAAQIRLFSTKNLKRLALYCVHHHGIQNDDYPPYLDAIQPQYNVIMTSHDRSLVSAASSFSGNYLNGTMGSTGFSKYEYVVGKDSVSIVYGADAPRVGWIYSNIDLYVDNTYIGEQYHGTEEHPFTDINEALMFIKEYDNLHYRIRVKGTSVKYKYVWARDIDSAIEIIGYQASSGTKVYPSVHGMYIRNCQEINISNLLFNGDCYSVSDNQVAVLVWSSRAHFTGCTFDCANGNVSGDNKYGLFLRECDVYVGDSTFQNATYGISPYYYGNVSSYNLTGKSLTALYNLTNLILFIRGTDSLTSCTEWIHAASGAHPYKINASGLTSSLISLNSNYAVSEPFRLTSSGNVCMAVGKKVLSFTGTEVSI